MEYDIDGCDLRRMVQGLVVEVTDVSGLGVQRYIYCTVTTLLPMRLQGPGQASIFVLFLASPY